MELTRLEKDPPEVKLDRDPKNNVRPISRGSSCGRSPNQADTQEIEAALQAGTESKLILPVAPNWLDSAFAFNQMLDGSPVAKRKFHRQLFGALVADDLPNSALLRFATACTPTTAPSWALTRCRAEVWTDQQNATIARQFREWLE